MTDSRTAVTTRDVHSLLHWAPRSRAVIVCGELAGIGAATIERLVRQRAPQVPVLAAETPLNGRASARGDWEQVTESAASRSEDGLALA